ncbi:MAG: LysE family transporter [Brumimicrobium sp.]
MTQIILHAIVTGLILSVMIGPAFFLLLEISIRRGIRIAIAFDLGVLTADVIYILIAYFFIHQVEELSQGEENAYLRMIGGIIFIVYGIFTFTKKISEISLKHRQRIKGNRLAKIKPKDYAFHYIKGLLVNLANPLIVFFWFFVIASSRSVGKNANNDWELFIFLIFVLGTFFAIDILKIVGAKQLRPFITSKLLSSMNRITGSILMIFGVFLLISSIIMLLK